MSKIFHTVYKIKNTINGKIYVGYHRTLDPHDDYYGSGLLINRAIKKYGKENFKKEILFIYETEKEAKEKEAEIVNEEFVGNKNTYNLNVGGFGSNYYNVSRGNCHTPEANKKRSESKKKWYQTEEGRAHTKSISDRQKRDNVAKRPEVRERIKVAAIANSGMKGRKGEMHPTFKKVTAFNLLTKETEKISKEEYDKSPIHTTTHSTMKIIMGDNVFYNLQMAVDYLWETRNMNGAPFKSFFIDNMKAILNNTKIINKKTAAAFNYYGLTWSALGITILKYNPKTEVINKETLYEYQNQIN